MSSVLATISAKSGTTGWDKYFNDQPDHDDILVDGRKCAQRLSQLAPVLFGASVDVEIIETLANSTTVTRKTVQDEDRLGKEFNGNKNPQFRILSITQRHSLSPLDITEDAMCNIFTHHHIPPGFIDVLCGFGYKTISSDDSSGSGFYSTFNEQSCDIFYQFWYVEQNGRKHGDPWSLRQTGVYHRFSRRDAAQQENLWLLLHPMPNSNAQGRLRVAAEKIDVKDMALDPLRLHILIINSYLDNWRWYLHDIKRQFIELEDTLMTTELRTRHEEYGLNFDTLQTLRHLASKLIPIPSMLQASIATIASIQATNEQLMGKEGSSPKLAETAYYLASFVSRLRGHIATTLVLRDRIDNTTKFLADGLNLKNQDISADSNNHLVTLTNKTADDSAAVRAITVVTLLYLPASFISGLFGMNLFNFNNATSAFQISSQFWIYVVATVSLMVFTMGCYGVYRSRHQKQLKIREATKTSPV